MQLWSVPYVVGVQFTLVALYRGPKWKTFPFSLHVVRTVTLSLDKETFIGFNLDWELGIKTLWNSNHSSLLMVLLIPEGIRTTTMVIFNQSLMSRAFKTNASCAFVMIIINIEFGGERCILILFKQLDCMDGFSWPFVQSITSVFARFVFSQTTHDPKSQDVWYLIAQEWTRPLQRM